MRLSNVPPPMALHEIALESNAIDVTVTVDHRDIRVILIGVLHCGGVSLYEWPVTSMIHQPPSHKWTANPMSDGGLPTLMYIQGAFGARNSLQICLLLLSHDMESSIVSVLTSGGHVLGKLSSHSRVIEGIVTNGPCTNSGTYIVAEKNKNLAGEDMERDISRLNDDIEIGLKLAPPIVGRADAIRYAGTLDAPFDEAPAHEEIIFSLSENGSLFANERRLARNCTSFLVTPAHLIFTTSQHLLKFAHMAKSTEGMIRCLR